MAAGLAGAFLAAGLAAAFLTGAFFAGALAAGAGAGTSCTATISAFGGLAELYLLSSANIVVRCVNIISMRRFSARPWLLSLGETFFDGLLLEFSKQYPQVQIELELNNSYRDLARDGFDLGVRSGAIENERLVAKPLLAWHEMTCASPAYLEQHGEPQTPADLAAHTCLLNSHYSGREEWLYHQQHELLRVRVSGTFASNHYNLLKKAALVGAGIARLPSYVLPAELADGRLRWLLRDYQTRSMPMYLVHPYQGGLPRRTQVLADYLVDWFKRSGEALDRL